MFIHKIKRGFTLVELIIVVTILAILATISFISFKSYTKNARDSNRLVNLRNIDTGLQTYFSKSQKYPLPENYISLLSSGTLIGYQGYFGDEASRLIKMSSVPTDNLDSSKLTYSVNQSQNSYQILTFLENGNNLAFELPNIINKTYAAGVDYSKRFPKSVGKDLGVLLGSSGSYLNTPLQDLKSASFTGIDVKTYNGNIGGNNIGNLKAIFNKERDTISGTGGQLIRLDLIYKNKVSILMSNYCSNGWTKDGYYSIYDGGAGISEFNSSIGSKVCEGNSNEIIPKGNNIIVANQSCPTGFDLIDGYLNDGGYYTVGTQVKFNCDYFNNLHDDDKYYSCLVCESKGSSIPSGTKLIMKQCGVGYKEISDFILADDGINVTYSYIPENSSIGQNLKICEKL